MQIHRSPAHFIIITMRTHFHMGDLWIPCDPFIKDKWRQDWILDENNISFCNLLTLRFYYQCWYVAWAQFILQSQLCHYLHAIACWCCQISALQKGNCSCTNTGYGSFTMSLDAQDMMKEALKLRFYLEWCRKKRHALIISYWYSISSQLRSGQEALQCSGMLYMYPLTVKW